MRPSPPLPRRVARAAAFCSLATLAGGAGPRTALAQQVELDPADAIAFPAPFSLINGARELSDGRVVVSDWIEQRVEVLDFTSGHRTAVGGVGGGPSEFRLPGAVLPFRGDSTILVDRGNSRLGVIGPDGTIHRTIPAGRPGASSPGAVDDRGRVYYVQPGWATGDPPGSTAPRPLVAWDPETDAIDEIARVDAARPRSDAGEPRMTPGIPFVMFAARDGWAAASDGSVAIVRWSPFAVEWHGDGEVVRGPPLSHEPSPVTDEDREAFVRRFLEQTPISGRGPDGGLGQTPSPSDREIRDMVATNEFALEHAPFDPAGISVDPAGRLWIVRTPPTRDPVTIDIFDRTAARIAAVTLPPGRSFLAAGSRYVYAVVRDDLDLETLERYELQTLP